MALGKVFHTNNLVFLWDSKSSDRKKIFPRYKWKRSHDRSKDDVKKMMSLFNQMKKLRREILPLLGFENIRVRKGREADDLIGSICRNLRGRFCIISADKDLFQLLNHNVYMYNPSQHKLISVKTFRDLYGIEPSQWVEVKTIAGCPTDGIPGVPGVALKTACKFVRGELDKDSKKFKDIEKATEWRQTSRLLQHLPLCVPPHLPCEPIVPNRLSMDSVTLVAKRYGLASFLDGKNRDIWKQFIEIGKK